MDGELLAEYAATAAAATPQKEYGYRNGELLITTALDTVWSEDAVPAGAAIAGDGESWNWVSSNPGSFSGSTAHQSNLVAGLHQHYFYGATATLSVNTGTSWWHTFISIRATCPARSCCNGTMAVGSTVLIGERITCPGV